MSDKAHALREQDVIAPDPLEEMRAEAACLPADRDVATAEGRPTTDHDESGWRAIKLTP